MAQTVEEEVEAFVAAHEHITDGAGRRMVIRNGNLPERTIQCGIADPVTMDKRIILPEPMGLKDRMLSMSLGDRIHYNPEANTLFLNFAGLIVRTGEYGYRDLWMLKAALECYTNDDRNEAARQCRFVPPPTCN